MKNEPNTAFVITGWNEDTLHDYIEGKITRASVALTYSGAIEGPGSCEYIMAYTPGGTAEFFGYELVSATIDGKKGTFVFEHKGAFEGGKATDTLRIVPGSGTGALAGITGQGGYSVAHGEEYRMWFEWEL